MFQTPSIVPSLVESRSSDSLESLTRKDSSYDFIVYKLETVDSRPLYPSSMSSISSRSSSRRRHSRKTIPSKFDLDMESALAFGGTKRGRKPQKSRHLSPPSTNQSRSSSRSTTSSSTSSRLAMSSNGWSVASSPASTVMSDAELSLSAEKDKFEAWSAFRAKYALKHEMNPNKQRSISPFGRYSAGSGYVEYRHRKTCKGECEGACFGK